jgi:hypothetical protein
MIDYAIRRISPGVAFGMDLRIFSASGKRSWSLLDLACKTMTVRENLSRGCWNERFRSTVIKISNSTSAARSKRPFLRPAQCICGTVRTVCPSNAVTKRRSIHSSRRIFKLGGVLESAGFGEFQEGDHLRLFNGRKTVQKVVNGFPGLDIVKKGLYGDTCPCENRSSAQYITRDAYDLFLHRDIMLRREKAFKR